jgi:VIT1/CCC1 family predicted Fe2+/Mn2+ transporter
MAVGEYVSVASQRDIEHADVQIERKALQEHPVAELRELALIWESRGLEPELAEEVARQLTEKDALAAHVRDELGLTADTAARPAQAAVASLLSFTLGALVPLIAYLATPSGRSIVAVAASVLALAGLGWVGAALGSAAKLRAIARVAIGGTVAMAITLLIGELTGAALG